MDGVKVKQKEAVTVVKCKGKKSCTWFGPTPKVLQGASAYKRAKVKSTTQVVVNGLGSHEGQQWAKHKKIINPAFHQEKLKRYDRQIGEEDFNRGVRGCYLTHHLAVAMRKEEGYFNFRRSKMSLRSRPYNQFTSQVGGILFLQPVKYNLFAKYLPTQKNKRMKEIDREVKSLLKSVVVKKMMAVKGGKGSSDDLLSILLESSYKDVQQHGNKNGGMSMKSIWKNASYSTSLDRRPSQFCSSGLWSYWISILLGKYVLERRFGHNKPDYDGLNRLKIVHMIMYEVLRLYLPVAMLKRRVHKERAQLEEITLPFEVQITLPVMIVHRDRDLWGDDMEEFKPERFSKGVSKETNHQASLFPFGLGSRICIRQSFAMLEAKLALATISQHFSFELSTSYAHPPYNIITMQP
ncbi:hypothetical protein RJ639_040583 [Escallonia herrerae]|uniref:Cytochrome P450 n=1 Tax=Escallonia herrerae TaxID=1293975 RepID=A0AA88WMR6_9ASTE|nr:hypothetical protein RJ639_040583 [Escallonia herrerae]